MSHAALVSIVSSVASARLCISFHLPLPNSLTAAQLVTCCSFSTPLWFSNDQMALLRGTTLHKAASLHRRRLEAQWARLQPSVRAMLEEVGVSKEPAFEHFLWAYSVFWSRGQSLPVTLTPGTVDAVGR